MHALQLWSFLNGRISHCSARKGEIKNKLIPALLTSPKSIHTPMGRMELFRSLTVLG